MVRGAILPPVSTAVLQPAAPAGTPQRSIAVIAIRQALGANILIRSIAEQKPARPAAHRPMITQTIVIPMARGFRMVRRSISAPRRARLAETLAMNTQTTPTQTATANATTAAQPSV